MAKNEALTRPQGNVLESLDRYIADKVPGAGEDGLASMLDQVMTAESPEEWEALWQDLDNLQDNNDREIRVHGIRSARSTVEGSGEFYLIADVTWLDTGERGPVGVSAVMPLAQLVKCHAEGWFPRDFRIEVKAEATAAGFHPIHLRTLPKTVEVQQELAG